MSVDEAGPEAPEAPDAIPAVPLIVLVTGRGTHDEGDTFGWIGRSATSTAADA